MLRADYIKRALIFQQPAGTSRGILKSKDSWYIILADDQEPGICGVGECSVIPGLSIDKTDEFEQLLNEICKADLDDPSGLMDLSLFPAIQFGLETAIRDLNSGGNRVLYPSDFTEGERGIPINGLIWMGDKQQMVQQVARKLDAGFRILKFKVGAIDFKEELEIIKSVRGEYLPSELEIRLDANGAWNSGEAMEKLNQLSEFAIHSIEQPIAAGQWKEMAKICEHSPIDIALDEELIGLPEDFRRNQMLETIQPAYIILKPSLLGGLEASEAWIDIAENRNIGWWVTSALESNIGLNAIAQWTANLHTKMPQGLGTGELFSNNFSSPLKIRGDQLFYMPGLKWELDDVMNR